MTYTFHQLNYLWYLRQWKRTGVRPSTRSMYDQALKFAYPPERLEKLATMTKPIFKFWE